MQRLLRGQHPQPRSGKPAAAAAPPGRGTGAPAQAPRGCRREGGPAQPTRHPAVPRLPLAPQGCREACRAQPSLQEFLANHKVISQLTGPLYCTQHSTVTTRCPTTHAVEGYKEQGFFASRVSEFCYHSRESWETPRRRPHSRFGVSTSPAARGEGPSRGSTQPCVEHPQLQLPIPSTGASTPHPAPEH